MAGSEVSWTSALTPEKAPTYGNQGMFVACPKKLQVLNVDYVVVFEGVKKYHVVIAKVVNPFTLHVIIPEHDTAEEVTVKVFVCQNSNLSILTSLKFTYISQMEHAVAKFLAYSVSDPEVAEKFDAVWSVCLGKDHQELWDKRLAQAFAQLELPIEWTLVGDILQKDSESQQTLLHFAANHGLKELINVFLDLPGAKRALSTYDKSGLLPRDVARENGRLDLVELLDTDRIVEQRRGGYLSDGRRRVLRNKENGFTTITNIRNHNIQEDIQLLRELNKLVKVKIGSPTCRHSWPARIQSFNPDEYVENLEKELSKVSANIGDVNHSKRLFLDDNLICLRDITEELCQLRLQNFQRTSKEISIIADHNRRPMHSRRLSCPASVNRRKRGSEGPPFNPQARHGARASESQVNKSAEDKTEASTEPIFSTPPHSPLVGQLIDIGLPTMSTPLLDEPFEPQEDTTEPCEFMTPLANTPSASPTPTSPPPPSPLPISLQYSSLERRSHSSRKDRPRTWYGGTSETVHEQEMSRRSNSLEDFANMLALNDTDDESLPETTSKENILQEIPDRSASFLSSQSDLSVGKAESLCSEVETGHEDGSDEAKDSDEGVDIGDPKEHKNNEEQEDNEEHEGVEEHQGIEKREDYEEHADNEEHEENEEHRDNEEHEENEEHRDIGEHESNEEHRDIGEHESNEEDRDNEEHEDNEEHLDCEEHEDEEKSDNNEDNEKLGDIEEIEDNEGYKDDKDCETLAECEELEEQKEEPYELDKREYVEEPGTSEEHREQEELSDVANPRDCEEHEGHAGHQELKEMDCDCSPRDYEEHEGHAGHQELKEIDETIKPSDESSFGESLINEGQHEVAEDYENDDTLIADSHATDQGYVGDEQTEEFSDHGQIEIDIISKENECEVNTFCLPRVTPGPEESTVFQFDKERTGELEMEQSKHIRFNETIESSTSPTEESLSKTVDSDTVNDHEAHEFRQRSTVLFVPKAAVKRTGSDISVTSLQDVQLDMHSTGKDESLTPGVLKAARKARSYGDLSAFSEIRTDMKDEESDEERQRFEEDQKELSVQKRIKKFEEASSMEKLDQIATSQVGSEREDEEQGKRRWSNFFYAKNTRPGKKPGRTPTFRRDTLRSSMSSLKSVKPGGKKLTIESLVAGNATASAFARHSATAPNLQVATGRPRSGTKDSPGSIRKSPTTVSIDSDEVKVESPEGDQVEEVEAIDLEVDSDLENFDREPEAWSVTVEKKVLKKMSTKEIKRQDVILELVQTEGHHARTLKIMQQVFYRGLHKMANYSTDRLDQLFPRINELVEISTRFHRNLRCRQDEGASVQKIGDVIVKQFSGENGQLITDAYGEFVSKHPEAVALYKHYFKTDKKFSNFIKKCHGHRIVRRLSVPECFTLVTQRLTKYPMLIEAIMKATKTSNADHKELQKSLYLVKDAVKAVDNAIIDYEKQTRLKDIKMRMEKGSVVVKGGQKIKNSRFVEYQSKMIQDGVLQWKNARGRLTETHVVLLESMVAFLQENDKKFSLLSIDGKSPCISLKTLMIREVATDKNAMYFVSTSKKGPEMYEFVCSNPKGKRQWISVISEAITKAPDETGDLFTSPEEEKRLAEERLVRRDEILEIMKNKDQELSVLVEDKNKLFAEMKELLHASEGNYKPKEDDRILSNDKARSILLSVINRTRQLTVDSIQIHESHSDSELAAAAQDEKMSAPKRAETFGGFDRRPSQKGLRRTTGTITEGSTEGSSEVNHVSQRRDSGFSTTSSASESVASVLSILNQGQDGGPLTFLQMLEALQWILVQFSLKETALETLRAHFQTALEENTKLRSLKLQNDKKQLLVHEAHQAELTRQKKTYNELERTFNEQVSRLKTELQSQQEQQHDLFKNFTELRQALTENYPSSTS